MYARLLTLVPSSISKRSRSYFALARPGPLAAEEVEADLREAAEHCRVTAPLPNTYDAEEDGPAIWRTLQAAEDGTEPTEIIAGLFVPPDLEGCVLSKLRSQGYTVHVPDVPEA